MDTLQEDQEFARATAKRIDEATGHRPFVCLATEGEAVDIYVANLSRAEVIALLEEGLRELRAGRGDYPNEKK